MKSLDIFSPPLTVQSGKRQLWGGLSGSSLGLAIANFAEKFQGLTLVVTENSQQAERLQSELEFFTQSNSSDSLFQINVFPDWETLPYDNFSAHQDIISQRLETLFYLPQRRRSILIVSITTLMHKLTPASYVRGNSLMLKVGEKFNFENMRKSLEMAGYLCVNSVYEHGEFTVRGSIMDIFPMGCDEPYRIDLFDDEIESLRSFDPETQRSLGKVEEIRLLPGKEYPLNKQGISTFRRNFREYFDIDVRKCTLYEDISQGISSPGIEYYLPLFFAGEGSAGTQSLFDYLPENVLLFTTGDLKAGAEQFWREINARYEDRSVDWQRPILSPESLFIPVNELFSHFKNHAVISLHFDQSSTKEGQCQLRTNSFPDLSINQKLDPPLYSLQQFLVNNKDTPVLFCTDSAGRRETLLDLLKTIQVYPQVIADWQGFYTTRPALAITVAALDMGLWLSSPSLIVITESQLFSHHVSQRRRRGKFVDNTDFIVKSLTELHIAAPVVHIDHGIGRYRGLQTFDIDGQKTEFLVLEYAEAAKLYVPVSSLHLISRYSGADADAAPLHKLGNNQWQKAKRKAAEKIIDVAAELLEVYARRASKKGHQFDPPDQEYQLFVNSFPFEETEGQEQSIAAVIEDMTSELAMDRLICGDVGFGKTEVAMRAAFLAVQNNTQVAILVPTTLLAQQHYENFKDRFADWPVNVALMSRFITQKKQAKNLQMLAAGAIDIVIGTHKLLQAYIKYKNLGLLIIDEEHRFGVRQKEQLKALRANVDILTLTATPIPRTLNMAMSGMRDLSIIATPPAKRLAIKTFVRQSQQSLIKEALLRELLRGGQVFFLHNEVRTIERAAAEIRELIPEARVCVAHGQLRERELERVMSDFYHKRYNVLVCSTIIETGIDIPSANTIIIERADKFGLAQLHQLRGRVGRSHHQAYAYMLTPHPKAITSDARKRLEAISAADTLGAGFTLASHDLEIRGAGELLGDEQSGHIQTIGFTLYSEMLEQTVKMMKEGKHPDINKPLHGNTEINLRIPALIPESYLPDVHTRLLMYKRIANAASPGELVELKVEMIDRFGLLPESSLLLFDVTHLKLAAEALGIIKIEANVKGGKIEFKSDTCVDPYAIVKMVQEQPQIFNLNGATELRFKHDQEEPIRRLDFINTVLQELTPTTRQVA